MKRRLLLFFTMILLLVPVALTGCGNKNITECDFCSEEKSCVTRTVFGEEVFICEDCIGELNALAE